MELMNVLIFWEDDLRRPCRSASSLLLRGHSARIQKDRFAAVRAICTSSRLTAYVICAALSLDLGKKCGHLSSYNG